MCDFGQVISSLDIIAFIPQMRTKRFQRLIYRPKITVDAKAIGVIQFDIMLSHKNTHTHTHTALLTGDGQVFLHLTLLMLWYTETVPYSRIHNSIVFRSDSHLFPYS